MHSFLSLLGVLPSYLHSLALLIKWTYNTIMDWSTTAIQPHLPHPSVDKRSPQDNSWTAGIWVMDHSQHTKETDMTVAWMWFWDMCIGFRQYILHNLWPILTFPIDPPCDCTVSNYSSFFPIPYWFKSSSTLHQGQYGSTVFNPAVTLTLLHLLSHINTIHFTMPLPLVHYPWWSLSLDGWGRLKPNNCTCNRRTTMLSFAPLRKLYLINWPLHMKCIMNLGRQK